MERRHQTRSPTRTQTRINYEPLGVLPATISNFSPSGLFLEVDNPALKINHTLELIADSRGQRRPIPPVKAIIVRRSPKGIGLNFLEPCPRFIDTLSTL